MDLKCPSSGEVENNRLENMDLLTRRDEVKFVIGDRDDFLWASNMVSKYDLSNRCGVLFSPVVPSLEPSTLADWMVEQRVFARLNLQLHKILWPQRNRGV
jgi:7-carboxy-7-deazaguanine synthase